MVSIVLGIVKFFSEEQLSKQLVGMTEIVGGILTDVKAEQSFKN